MAGVAGIFMSSHLKNTVSASACKGKMHLPDGDECFVSREGWLPAVSVAPTFAEAQRGNSPALC